MLLSLRESGVFLGVMALLGYNPALCAVKDGAESKTG